MNMIGLINLGVLPLLLEALTPGYAQAGPEALHPFQEQRSQPPEPKGRPERQEPPGKPQEPRPERRPQAPEPKGRPERQEPPRTPPESRPERKPVPRRPPEPMPQPRPREPQPARPAEPKRPTRPDVPQRPPAARPGPLDRSRERPQPLNTRPQANQVPAPHASQSRLPLGPVSPEARREEARQHIGALQERRARNWQSEHRTWGQRGGYDGYSIPMRQYRSSFGPGHGFRMSSFPLQMMGGFPRFQFGGMWFSVLDPWPEYWAEDWFFDDDLYIESFGGGYYLRNRRHPMDRIAVTVLID